jgi:hypothetical protein
MNDKVSYRSLSLVGDFRYEIPCKFVAIEVINSQPAFDSAGNFNDLSHSLNTFLDKLRLLHETGSKGSFLDSR